jgi:cell division protein FtsN
MRRVRRQRGSRAGTLLVLSGVVGVLAVTFVAGVWTGRHWPLLSGSAAPPGTSAEAPAGRPGAGERPRQAEPLPTLTFYHELTAPLTAPPPVPKPTRPARPPEARPGAKREAEKAEAAPASTPPAAPAVTLPAPAPTTHPAGAGFTIQVGAYNVRTPADTLRATLAAAGHDARVVEAGTPAGVRYRVQVGAFPTREAAKETAARLAAERSLPAFVTAR